MASFSLCPAVPQREERTARVLAMLFYAVGLLQLVSVGFALTHVPLQVGWDKMLASPWSVTALVDYLVGVAFGMVVLWLLDGPPLLYLPGRVWAFAYPLLGNVALLTYAAFLLTWCKSATAALLPATYRLPTAEPCHRRRTSALGVLFFTLLVGFIGVCVWAMSAQTLDEGWRHLTADVWSAVTFIDNLAGLVFTLAFVVLREGGGVHRRMVVWTVALLLFGNGATCLYVLLVVQKSLIRNVSFESTLLSKVDTYV